MDVKLYGGQDIFELKGSSMMKSMQDFSMPIIDIFVRESIQNSLDAQDPDASEPNVVVEYTTGDYDVDALNSELDGIDISAKKGLTTRFIAVRDNHTKGLTGTFRDRSSNLHKLTVGFMENQTGDGAGGSWGLGKTVYFRVGMGLVIYYSRVKVNDIYESLMVATIAENENYDPIVPPVEDERYGIAVWGELVDGRIRETRDPETIEKVLHAFGYRPFGDTETGTAIIIPSVSETDLMSGSIFDKESDDSEAEKDLPYWVLNIEDSISMAVQRWYPARLNNQKYRKLFPHSKSLTVRINGKQIKFSDQRKFSNLLCDLYTKAALSVRRDNYWMSLSQSQRTQSNEKDTLALMDSEIKGITFEGIPIKVSQVGLSSKIDIRQAGQVSYIRIKKSSLNDGFSFYEYAGIEAEAGTPVMVYSRKPGMIVNYEAAHSPWNSRLSCSEDEYLICFFVLNSYASLSKAEMSLENYVRSGENSMHDRWEDKIVGREFNPCTPNYNPGIVSKLISNTAKKVFEGIAPEKPEEGDKRRNGEMSSLLGSIFFPVGTSVAGRGRPTDDGPDDDPDDGSSGGGNNGGPGRTVSGVHFSFEIEYVDSEQLVVPVTAKTRKNHEASGFRFELSVASANEAITADKWKKDMEIGLPFYVEGVDILSASADGEEDVYDMFKTHLVEQDGEAYAIDVETSDNEKHVFEIKMNVRIRVVRRDARPVINFKVK